MTASPASQRAGAQDALALWVNRRGPGRAPIWDIAADPERAAECILNLLVVLDTMRGIVEKYGIARGFPLDGTIQRVLLEAAHKAMDDGAGPG